jgi:D-sedoheptulose 7-phosphate isomerase
MTSPHFLDHTIERHPALAPLRATIVAAVEAICQCHRNGGKILLCGNGGSAADAEHIVGELVKEFSIRRPIPQADAERLEAFNPELAAKLQRGLTAISLVSQTAVGTAIANDVDGAMVFAQQVYAYGKPGDIVWGISTSGNSRNVVQALQVAKAFGLHTIGMDGQNPGAMDEYCDVLFKVPETQTYKIQELHLPIYHAICILVEYELFRTPEEPDA